MAKEKSGEGCGTKEDKHKGWRKVREKERGDCMARERGRGTRGNVI